MTPERWRPASEPDRSGWKPSEVETDEGLLSWFAEEYVADAYDEAGEGYSEHLTANWLRRVLVLAKRGAGLGGSP